MNFPVTQASINDYINNTRTHIMEVLTEEIHKRLVLDPIAILATLQTRICESIQSNMGNNGYLFIDLGINVLDLEKKYSVTMVNEIVKEILNPFIENFFPCVEEYGVSRLSTVYMKFMTPNL